MSIGQITLNPLKFNVSSSLQGLRGLDGYISIASVDVTGGTTQGITLGINGTYLHGLQLRFQQIDLRSVTIENPSNLKLTAGDLCTFVLVQLFYGADSDMHTALQLYRDTALLGTTLIPNLTLELGSNTASAQATFDVSQ